MTENLDFSTLIFILATVFIFYQLRRVLGRRTGKERQPFDPYSARYKKGDSESSGVAAHHPSSERSKAASGYELIDEATQNRPDLNKGLREIKKADGSFNPEDFIKGAKAAYEMIVVAYAAGDKKILKELLSEEVFKGFLNELEKREKKSERIEASFIGIEEAEFISAEVRGLEAQITIRFISKTLSTTFDKGGNQIAGDPKNLTEMHDIWTFTRNIHSGDPNWKLSATENEEKKQENI